MPRTTHKGLSITEFKYSACFHHTQQSLDSSVGRAEDCRGILQLSLGHWFESGSRDIFEAIEITENKKHDFLQYTLVKDWTLGLW